MSGAGDVSSLTRDPRRPEHAALRASDADREVVPRREALWGFLAASLICWTIWLVGAWGPNGLDPGFPWPLFVMLGTGLNVGRVQFRRDDEIASERRRLEKKQRKQLEQRHKEDDT